MSLCQILFLLTTYQLLQYLEDVTVSVDHGLSVDAIYIDFSKAFNSDSHERILCKLSALGSNGKLLKWIRSFQTNKKEVAVVKDSISESKLLLSWVPQGSCLEPLPFIGYVNEADACLKHGTI